MPETLGRLAEADLSGTDDVATAISTLAWTHGITATPELMDAFADATARLCDTEVAFDHTERLLLGPARGGFVTDEQRFALHATYLQQKASDVRPVR
jgi:hypothetical protein